MSQLLFLSAIYWLNFAILLAFKCIDFFPVIYFYLFLVFFVFPIGHSCYKLLFAKRIELEETFLVVVKILLGIPVIALVNFIFGINYVSNAVLFIFSYAYIILFNMRQLKKLLSHKISLNDLKASYVFVIIFSGLFTSVSKNSFKIYNFFSDHITIVPYPSDSSQYYAVISSLVRHIGSFIHGYKIALYGGVNSSAISSLLEIFESVFIKFSGTDIILFHSVIFSLFLIFVFFCVCFLSIFKKELFIKKEFNSSWNLIFLGLAILALFSYVRLNCSLLRYSIAALHMFLSWVYLLVAMKIYFSSETLLKKDINTRPCVLLAFFLCFIGFFLHMFSVGIFLLSFLAYLVYRRLSLKDRRRFVLIWAFAAIGLIAILAGIFKDYAFVFGELRVSIRSFYPNIVAFRPYVNDLFFLKLISRCVLGVIHSNPLVTSMTSGVFVCFLLPKSKPKSYFLNGLLGICVVLFLINFLAHCPQKVLAPVISSRPSIVAMCMPYMVPIAIAGSICALFCFLGYFFVIPIYLFVSKSKLKFYFLNILLGVWMVLLLINYLISHRPSFAAVYMPIVTSLAVVLMVMEIILSNVYFKFQKVSVIFKSIIISFLTILVLYFNHSMFSVPYEKLNIDKKLYDVIEYVKKNTPSGSILLHNLERSPYYAYFSGFAYRDVVMERYAYAFAFFKDHDDRFADIVDFYKKDAGPDLRRGILDKYSVTHILSSPDCPVDLKGNNFEPVFSSGEYTLYEYRKI